MAAAAAAAAAAAVAVGLLLCCAAFLSRALATQVRSDAGCGCQQAVTLVTRPYALCCRSLPLPLHLFVPFRRRSDSAGDGVAEPAAATRPRSSTLFRTKTPAQKEKEALERAAAVREEVEGEAVIHEGLLRKSSGKKKLKRWDGRWFVLTAEGGWVDVACGWHSGGVFWERNVLLECTR